MPLQFDAPETGQQQPLSMAHGGSAASLANVAKDESYHARVAPTSSATLNSILTTTTTPTIPQKRKLSTAGLEVYHYNPPNVHPSSHHHNASPALLTTPPPHASPQNDVSTDAIDCMCGFTIDDGYSIQCDSCSRWCHAVCFGIMKGDTVPEVWACWVCQPRPREVREAAVRMQSERFSVYGGGGLMGGGLLLIGEDEVNGREGKRGRKLSPGHDRKGGRRGSAAGATAMDGGKRRRRPSTAATSSPHVTSLNTVVNGTGAGASSESGAAEDHHVDIDEPWKDSYVHISEDIVPSDETRYKLRKQAMNWRGITAVSTPPPIAVKELPPQTAYNPLLTLNSNPSVLPPTYGLHTTAPIPSDRLITPYTSSITPSSSYLSDPLNAYAHLGMPKPFVHLLGPPLDVALDSRLVGNYGRFVRSGCRPNAVLRPVLCNKRKEGDEDKENRETEEDGRTLGFGVFALRDLKAGEEIVLGWEWDDGNAVHYLPALLSTPHMFPADRFHLNSTPTFSSPEFPTSTSTPASTSDFASSSSNVHSSLHARSPHEIAHLRAQMSNILHALSSTFTTCACGGRARDCVLTQMATFVDSPPEDGTSPRDKATEVDLGPLVGRKRGFKTRERIPNSGGIGGMEMWVDGEGGSRRVNGGTKHVDGSGGGSMGPPPVPASRRSKSPVQVGRSRKGKERAFAVEDDEMEDQIRVSSGPTSTSNSSKPQSSPPSSSPTPKSRPQTSRPPPPDPPPVPPDPKDEMKMPPKMRKKWMHHALERLIKDRNEVHSAERETQPQGLGLGIRIEVEDTAVERDWPMPPPAAVTVSTRLNSPGPPTQTLSRPSTKETASKPPLPAPSPSPLTSFANLSLLSPALLDGPQTPSLPLSSQQKKTASYPFPPPRTQSPSPSRLDEPWTPLRRVEPSEKSAVVPSKAEKHQEDRESSIASSSGGAPRPSASTESEDVEMEELARTEDDVAPPPLPTDFVDVQSEVDRLSSPSTTDLILPPPQVLVQDPQPVDDEAPQHVHQSPTPPPPSETAPIATTSAELLPEPSPTITIVEPAPRPSSSPHSISVQPSPATLPSSLPSPSPSPAPGAHASTSQQAAVPAQPTKVKLTLQDFVLRKKKQKAKEELERAKETDVVEERERKEEKEAGKENVREKEAGSEMKVDGAEKDQDKDVDMAGPSSVAAPAAANTVLSPTATTPAFDPKAFSEAAAAILNGQHRPSPLELVNGIPRIRGASPLVAALPSKLQPHSRSQSRKEPSPLAQPQPTVKANETREMKREVVEASLSLPPPVSAAVGGSSKEKSTPPFTESKATNPPAQSNLPQQQSTPIQTSEDWSSRLQQSMPLDVPPWIADILTGKPKTPVSGILSRAASHSAPVTESMPQREHDQAQDRLRSVSPMGPDLLRPEVQASFGGDDGGGFNAHSRMPSREDGEIVGETSPPLVATTSSPNLFTSAGRGPRQPSLPMSPSVPTATTLNLGPAETRTAPRLQWGSSASPTPSFTRGPPTGPSYYQRMVASRAGRPAGSEGSANFNSTGANATAAASTSPNTPQPEPPKAPRALRQSMLGNRGGAGSGSGGATSPVNSNSTANPIPVPSPYTRTPSHVHDSASTAPTSSSAVNGASASQFIPRGPSADRERERDHQDSRDRYRLGDRDKDSGRDSGKDIVGGAGGGGASLRDRLDWDRYPRGSGSGLRRWGR